MSSTVSNYNPTYVDERQMGQNENDPYIGKNRAEKINSIIKQAYNQLVAHTDQVQEEKKTLKQLVSQKTNRVYSLRDVGFGEFHTISFTLNTAGMVKDKIYPLLVIKKGTAINEDISFLGVNDQDAPSKFLNSYGYFLYTYSDIAEEKQISFFCYDTPPNSSFGCFLNCLYSIDSKVN